MKKLMAIALACTLLAGVVAGCGSSSTSSSQAQGTTASGGAATSAQGTGELAGKLTVSVWDLSTSNYYQTIKEQFEAAHPGVEIEYIDTASADYTDKLSIMLNGGTAIDVIVIKDSDTSLSLNQKGHLEDLTPYIERDGVDLTAYNGLAENFNFDGAQAGMPFRTDYYVLYYNKDIFDAAEVEYPTNDMTWEEFETLATSLSEGSGTDRIYGAHLHTWQACVENWAVQDGANTIMGPDYEFMRSYYEMALRMQDAGVIQNYATLTTSNIHYSSAFYAGNVAMMPMGTWFVAMMLQAKEAGDTSVNWGVATLPHSDNVSAGNTVGSATPVAVNAASDNKDLAWEYVKFVTGAEGAAILADAGQFPAATTADTLTTITSVEGMPEDAAEALQVGGIVLDRPIVEKVNEVNAMLGEEHSMVMLGESTVDEFIETITERSAEILS